MGGIVARTHVSTTRKAVDRNNLLRFILKAFGRPQSVRQQSYTALILRQLISCQVLKHNPSSPIPVDLMDL